MCLDVLVSRDAPRADKVLRVSSHSSPRHCVSTYWSRGVYLELNRSLGLVLPRALVTVSRNYWYVELNWSCGLALLGLLDHVGVPRAWGTCGHKFARNGLGCCSGPRCGRCGSLGPWWLRPTFTTTRLHSHVALRISRLYSQAPLANKKHSTEQARCLCTLGFTLPDAPRSANTRHKKLAVYAPLALRCRMPSKCSPIQARHPLVPAFVGRHLLQPQAAASAASKLVCTGS